MSVFIPLLMYSLTIRILNVFINNHLLNKLHNICNKTGVNTIYIFSTSALSGHPVEIEKLLVFLTFVLKM